MLSYEEKKMIWNKVYEEFEDDPMLRDLHFIRALMESIRQKQRKKISYKQPGDEARVEFEDWLNKNPDLLKQHSNR